MPSPGLRNPPPSYTGFADENEALAKSVEWGLSTAKTPKTAFMYKGYNGEEFPCELVGYTHPAIAVIAFTDGALHCIHPSYLKEMQRKTFSRALAAGEGAPSDDTVDEEKGNESESVPDDKTTKPVQKLQDSQRTTAKLTLPEEKVAVTATIKGVTTKYDHFAQADVEILLYQNVTYADTEGNPIPVGNAWSSYSATLKKMDLLEGDTVTFEAKLAAKKHDIETPVKINNPSKMVKKT